MKRYFWLVFLFSFLLSHPGMAINTIIDGTAKAFKNRIVRLSTYSDLVTNRLELTATAVIDQEGRFSMQFDVPDTASYIISIGFRKTVIYLIPGGHYNCNINVNPDSIQQQRLPAAVQELPLLLENLPGNDINYQIIRFNHEAEAFLYRNAMNLKPANKKMMTDSVKAFQQKFNNSKGSFTDIYIKYKFADIESLINRWDDKMIYNKLLNGQDVKYNNPGYMDYFNVFFEHYLTTKTKNISFQELDNSINRSVDLNLLTDIAGKDSLLSNERIRELVLLKNLGELYYNPDFLSQNILSLIQKTGEKSKYPEHRIIAQNLLFQLTRLTKGSEAPAFSYIDQAKIERTLGDSRGKWVYLSFFTTWCESCVSALKVIPGIKQEFGNKVDFISVCCNENKLDLGYFLTANKNFNWTFFNLEDMMEIVDGYSVMTYPFYVLIDTEGKIFQYPAKSPEDNLKPYLEMLLK